MAVIDGTIRPETIQGTPEADTIHALKGDDLVSGGGGDDLIDGGYGDDALYGDAGADRLFGRAGNDSLVTEDEGDYASGQDGDDQFVAFAGHVTGGPGDDTFILGSAAGDAEDPRNVMGREVVKDFQHGDDLATVVVWQQTGPKEFTGLSGAETFHLLDSDGDGRIGDGDHGVKATAAGLEIDLRGSDVDRVDGIDFAGHASILLKGIDQLGAGDWDYA